MTEKAQKLTNENFMELYAKLSPENQSLLTDAVKEVYELQEGGQLEHIKVNLPASESEEAQGYGEGVFMLVLPEIKTAYDTDESGTRYTGILDNDSFNYPSLKHGALIPFEMRGTARPVASFNWLVEHYGAPVK